MLLGANSRTLTVGGDLTSHGKTRRGGIIVKMMIQEIQNPETTRSKMDYICLIRMQKIDEKGEYELV